MGNTKKLLGPIGHPLDRATDLFRRPNAYRFLGIDKDFGAEAAAHVGRNNPQFMLWRNADKRGQNKPRHVRVLAGCVKREGFFARVIIADCRAWFHSIGNKAVVDDIDLGDVLGDFKSGFRRSFVTQVPIVNDVVR